MRFNILFITVSVSKKLKIYRLFKTKKDLQMSKLKTILKNKQIK